MDIFELYMKESTSEILPENPGETEPLMALTECLRVLGDVNMSFLVTATGMSWCEVREALCGVIYQSPDRFLRGEKYDPLEDWQMCAKYLSGNCKEKLKRAKKAEKRFPGVFSRNIEALSKICPMEMKLSELHPDVGAAWIPAIEYEQFLYDVLLLSQRPSVYFIEERNKWVCEVKDSAKRSFENTTTYGVRGRCFGEDKQYATGIELFLSRLNAKTVEIFDYIPVASGGFSFKYEPYLNREMTALAQDKERALCDVAFKEWVFADPARSARFENYYNDFFVGYVQTPYDGRFLTLPGANPAVVLFENQKSAVARAILSDENLLLAHDVGTGKTYEIIAAIHELHRLGKSRKNLVVVQNQTLVDFKAAHNFLYPDDKILVIEPGDMAPKYRNDVMADIRDGDYVCVYMPSSAFDLIDMSNEYYENKLLTQLHEAKLGVANASSSKEKAEFEGLVKIISKRVQKFYETLKPSPFMSYEDLGITTLVIDEIHTYKNITLTTHCKRIVGLRSKGSHKADSALEKAHFTPRLLGATATPLTNSIADLYTFQVYFQYDLLKLHKIHNFDAWINTFGERVTTIECDADANASKLRAVSRFSHFHNLNELRALFAQICDFYHTESREGVPECDGYTVIKVPIDKYQREGFEDISLRLQAIRRKEVDKHEDNLLKIAVDGRALALSAGFKYPEARGETCGKVYACAREVHRFTLEYPDCTQLVFCDIGTPKEGFNIYDELKRALVALGLNETQIAFVHDATSEKARERLFARANKGELKVIIGSVPKLGTGVNVQKKLVAIHHLTVPWKPSDLTQADGRIERFGNTCDKVYKYCYLTERTYDQYSWQILENKQRFIASFMCGGIIENQTADIGDTVLTYAEIKALTIGNPLVRDRVEVSIELERARIASRARQNELYSLRVLVETTPDNASDLRTNGFRVREDYEFYLKHREKISLTEREALGEELCASLLENVMKENDRVFCTYHGYQILLPADMTAEMPYVYLSRPGFRRYYCPLTNIKTNEGYSRALDQTLIQLKNRAEKLFASAEELIRRMEVAKEEMSRGNPHASRVDELTLKLTEIDEKLLEAA